jgi:hypothetical protein
MSYRSAIRADFIQRWLKQLMLMTLTQLGCLSLSSARALAPSVEMPARTHVNAPDQKTDFVRMPFSGAGGSPASTTPRIVAEGGSESSGSAPEVDVMVLYTTLAKAAYGEAGVKEMTLRAIGYLNEACQRSGVNARFRLVYQAETTWHAENPCCTNELNWLCADPKVAQLRDQAGADLVSLFVRDGFPNSGYAQLPGPFSVFNGEARLFAHECGHNLGCEHDRPNSAEGQCATCNFGYSFTAPGTADVYGDIMSYVGSPIDQFSNPDRYFLSAPTGLKEGHVNPEGKPDAADIAGFLNQSVLAAAQWEPTRIAVVDNIHLADDGSSFGFRIAGASAGNCLVESSADFLSWRCLSQIVLTGPNTTITDPSASDACRFYRTRLGESGIASYVGYVRKVVPPGWSMIANPLVAPDNSISALLTDAPEGTEVYKWDEGQQRWSYNSCEFGEWSDPEMTLYPGEGVFVRNNGGASFEIKFVGEMNQAFQDRVPLQFSIRGSAVPQAGGLSSVLQYVPFGPGGQILRLAGSGGQYSCYTFDGEAWSPSEPSIKVGEAFWCRNPINALIWQHVLPNAASAAEN